MSRHSINNPGVAANRPLPLGNETSSATELRCAEIERRKTFSLQRTSLGWRDRRDLTKFVRRAHDYPCGPILYRHDDGTHSRIDVNVADRPSSERVTLTEALVVSLDEAARLLTIILDARESRRAGGTL